MIPRLLWQDWTGGTWVTNTERTAALVSFTGTHGRADAIARPSPTTATIRLASEVSRIVPAAGARFRITLADELRTQLALNAAQAARFTGEVTDSTTKPATRLQRGTHDLTAVGRWGRGARKPISVRGWEGENDGARVARILAQTLISGDVGVVDGGTVRVVAPDPQGQYTAGALIDLVSDSSGGLLIEYPDGHVEWHNADHRRNPTSRVTIDGGQILSDLTWNRRVGDTINDVVVILNDGSAFRVRDTASIAALESYPLQITTALSNRGEAASRGTEIVGRRSRPGLQLSAVSVDVLRATDNNIIRGKLATLSHGDLITLTGLPRRPDASGTRTAQMFVEQVAETIYRTEGTADVPARNVWRRTLTLSPVELSGVSIRWQDVSDSVDWTDVNPTVSWLDAAQITNPLDLEA